jgi:hypothetical protein
MDWKHCTAPYGDSAFMDAAMVAVSAALELDARASGRVSDRIGLFCRDDDRSERTHYLLTPDAAKYVALMPGEWVDGPGPEEYGWTGLVSDVRTAAHFRIRAPRPGE